MYQLMGSSCRNDNCSRAGVSFSNYSHDAIESRILGCFDRGGKAEVKVIDAQSVSEPGTPDPRQRALSHRASWNPAAPTRIRYYPGSFRLSCTETTLVNVSEAINREMVV